MDYDFFNDENQQKEEEKKPECVPAPHHAEGKPTQYRRRKISWGKVVLSIALAFVFFGLGMLTTWASLDPEMRTLLTVKKKIQNDYYKEISDEDFYKTIFGGINNDLLDPYSRYMTPEEFAAMVSDMDGNRIGVGLIFTTQQEEPLRVTRVCGNSPAEAAGIVAGEKIIGCGKEETSITPCSTFEEFSACLSQYGEGEEFYVKVRAGETERAVKLFKAAYVENYVFYRTKDKAYTFTGQSADVLTETNTPLVCLDEDTAYIRLIQFAGNAGIEFAAAMTQFKQDGKKNLILDLRENGGGYLEIMQEISSYFCKNSTEATPVVAVADFGEKRTAYKAKGNVYGEYFSDESRICVLADRYSASASECLIGCMIDYGAIGYKDICLTARGGVAKTYGKGIMQETTLVNLLEQDAITLTTAEIRWPVSDNSIHDRGVLPEDGALVVEENINFDVETENAIKKLFG
ncbi:MAG: hypothetical protein J6B05_00355 [Clostridia bacterium]|nr:hypothetical protein [Clostridia bacterium]